MRIGRLVLAPLVALAAGCFQGQRTLADSALTGLAEGSSELGLDEARPPGRGVKRGGNLARISGTYKSEKGQTGGRGSFH